MYVSVEVITMLATAVTLLVAIIGGFGWMINRMDARFDAQDVKNEARFARVDERFDRVDERFDRVEERFARLTEAVDGCRLEITEVKIAVARLEGPIPRLMTVR